MRSNDNRRTKASTNDDCGCCVGCYPNGLVSLLLTQVLLLIGLFLSVLSLADCQFVRADVFALNSTPPHNSTAWQPNARTGFGLIAYQDTSGTCNWNKSFYEEGNHRNGDNGLNLTALENWEDHWDDYIEWLGDDWERPRYYVAASVGAAFVVFVWIVSMMCIAHIRVLRILAAAIPFFLIMPLQLASLSVLSSDFCTERSCVLDRSGVGAICAGFMYFVGGITLMFTKNYTRKPDDELEDAPETPRQSSAAREPAAIEMVDIVEDASFVIENDRARTNSDQVEEVVIGDGLAEALEIKPDMIFLHEDGENQDSGQPVVHQPAASPAAATPPEAVIPTVTDVQVVDELSKTKVAP